MVTQKYALPTMSFPYRITNRLAIMALPRRQIVDHGDDKIKFSSTGVRMSALRGRTSERVAECAFPYVRRLIILKTTYKERFSRQRLEKLDHFIAQSNGTIYTKLSNCFVKLKRPGNEDIGKIPKKRKVWGESDWRKHMDYISQISNPKPLFLPDPIMRGPVKPLEQLLPGIEKMTQVAQFKIYKRMSQETWYRDPVKVRPAALKYVISERVKKLAEPKVLPAAE